MLLTWSPSWPRQKASRLLRGGCLDLRAELEHLVPGLEGLAVVSAPITSIRQWAGQQSTAYGAPIDGAVGRRSAS